MNDAEVRRHAQITRLPWMFATTLAIAALFAGCSDDGGEAGGSVDRGGSGNGENSAFIDLEAFREDLQAVSPGTIVDGEFTILLASAQGYCKQDADTFERSWARWQVEENPEYFKLFVQHVCPERQDELDELEGG